MQVDQATHDRYQTQAPELLDSIEQAEESPWIMRKNPDNFCVKFEDGLCGIHKNYGDRFLGDACNFYPRVTRLLGTQIIMTASLSCPEIARLALFDNEPAVMTPAQEERLPSTTKNYLPDGMNEDDAMKVHQAFLTATEDATASAEQIFLRIASASRSLERIAQKSWPTMASYYLQHADSRIPPPQVNINDPFNLLHALCGLIVASHKTPSPRLRVIIQAMETALSAPLDWEAVKISADDTSVRNYQKLKEQWRNEIAVKVEPMLRRWLQMQMSLALYPFSGLGHNLSERVTIIGVRLAIIKLALLCNCSSGGKEPLEILVVRVVQTVSRFLDHLGDAEFSLKIFTETGWIHEGRMRGLLEK